MQTPPISSRPSQTYIATALGVKSGFIAGTHHKEDIINDLNQDLLKKIEELEKIIEHKQEIINHYNNHYIK
jgi:hypothetical protein